MFMEMLTKNANKKQLGVASVLIWKPATVNLIQGKYTCHSGDSLHSYAL